MFSRIFGIFRRRDLDCGQVRELASAYLDDEVGGQVRGRIAAHLGRCSLCKAFVDTLRATVSLLGSFERAEPPPSLSSTVRARIRREAGA